MPSDVEQGVTAEVEPQSRASGIELDNRASSSARATVGVEHEAGTTGPSARSSSRADMQERPQDYPFTRNVRNVVLLGLLASFICIFTWAWVDAFQKICGVSTSMLMTVLLRPSFASILYKANYDQAVGLMLILFFGTIVCTCGFRRRVAALSQMEEERIQTQTEQIDHVEEVTRGPKGVPPHIRKQFHYFIFEEAATTNEDMKESPPTPLKASLPLAGAGAGQDAPESCSGRGQEDGEGFVVESASIPTGEIDSPTVDGAVNGGNRRDTRADHEDSCNDVEGSSSDREGVSSDREADSTDLEEASTDHDEFFTASAASDGSCVPDDPNAEAPAEANPNGMFEPVVIVDESEEGHGTSRETWASWQERRQQESAEEAGLPSTEELGSELSQEHPSQRPEHGNQTLPTFAWASTTLTDCSVCLEAYKGGDRVCRLPCAHAFHATCIDTWLDQQHFCPQCRYNLLPERRLVMPPTRPDAIMPGDESSLSSLFSSPVIAVPTMPPHAVSALGRPYLTFPDTPQAGVLSPMASTTAMQSFRRSPGFTPRAGGRMRSTPVSSSNATIGTPRFSVFSSAASALVFPGAETPSTDGGPRPVSASRGPSMARPRLTTPMDQSGQQRQPHVQLPSRLQPSHRQQQQQQHDFQQEVDHSQVLVQASHHVVQMGQAQTQSQGHQHPHQARQRQMNPLQHARHGTPSASGVVSSIPGYATLASGGVVGGGLVNGGNASVSSHPANAVVNGNGIGVQSPTILSNGSIGLAVSSGHGQRRLRLPNLSRRPRGGSCDMITSPGLWVMGNSSTTSPKTGRAAALSSRGTPTFRSGGQFKGFPTLQVRMTSWDEGDDFAGSIVSSESCRRSRRGSEEWGTRDWGRGCPSSAAAARMGTESAAESQLRDEGGENSAVVRVVSRRSPSVEEDDDYELPFVEEDVERLSTMSATTSEHEYFARTMLYC